MLQPPRLIRWIAAVVLIFFGVLFLFRLLFYLYYKPAGYEFPGSAFLMGARLDLRIVCVTGLLMLLLCSVKWLNPFRRKGAKKFWTVFLTVLFFGLLLFYLVDFFHYDYLKQRLNASVLNYLQDAGISMGMVWETYPVIPATLLLAGLVAGAAFLFSRLLRRFQATRGAMAGKRSWVWTPPLVALLALGAWGSMGQFALRWSDVFTLGDPFRSQLALNPVQSFFSTLSFKSSTYDLAKAKKGYPLIAGYLGLEEGDSSRLSFERVSYPSGPIDSARRPNVVLVICESFSAYKSSMSGNPLNPTPYFDSLSRRGIYFDHCFTPCYGTARGVWALITGIPDVEAPKTASRNPALVDQRTIVNEFSGYEKFYFIGGSASWANIRGLLQNNIEGLQLFEQEDYQAEKVDVWGISDKNVFLHANEVLAKQRKPFFAMIQTADNHRPYTIPAEDLDEFQRVSLPQDSLTLWGFSNNEEFNAFRYTDFCFRKFMEAARKEAYFQNTVFVFIGDHGIRGDAGRIYPKAWTDMGLTTYHVPLLFYSPLLGPGRRTEPCSQLDVLPSIAGLLSRPNRNGTLGRNLFDTSLMGGPFTGRTTFIPDPDDGKTALVSGDYFFRKSRKTAGYELVSIRNNDPVPPGAFRDSLAAGFAPYADAFYEVSRYLLYHNKSR